MPREEVSRKPEAAESVLPEPNSRRGKRVGGDTMGWKDTLASVVTVGLVVLAVIALRIMVAALCGP